MSVTIMSAVSSIYKHDFKYTIINALGTGKGEKLKWC